jgi:putative transposase
LKGMSSGKIGVTMNRYGVVLPRRGYLASIERRTNISKEAKKRLCWLDHYRKTGKARLTCRYFGISPQTFYRWKNRYNPYDLKTLESRSSRPLRRRKPETPTEVEDRIKQLRRQYPRWGKDKLVILLSKEGIKISASTVGRVIKRLKECGILKEPINDAIVKAARKRRLKPRYAIRKPKGYEVKAPGDLVEVDTLVIKLLPNQLRYQFSARDVISKWDGIRVYSRQTSYCGAKFLEYLQSRYPFKIKAIQIDGGSEWKKDFEESCEKRGILLFVLPPNSPKLNGCVERANRTHREEFYELEEIELGLVEHNEQLSRWEHTYNYIRPHQGIDYLTPNEYYRNWLENKKTNGGNVSLTY